MADNNIWIVTSEYVDNNFSGDVTGTVAEYFEDVYGSSYTIDEFQGISIPSNRKDSGMCLPRGLDGWHSVSP